MAGPATPIDDRSACTASFAHLAACERPHLPCQCSVKGEGRSKMKLARVALARILRVQSRNVFENLALEDGLFATTQVRSSTAEPLAA